MAHKPEIGGLSPEALKGAEDNFDNAMNAFNEAHAASMSKYESKRDEIAAWSKKWRERIGKAGSFTGLATITSFLATWSPILFANLDIDSPIVENAQRLVFDVAPEVFNAGIQTTNVLAGVTAAIFILGTTARKTAEAVKKGATNREEKEEQGRIYERTLGRRGS